MANPRILVLDLNANPRNGTWMFATQFDQALKELGLEGRILTFTRSGKLSVGHADYDNLWGLPNKEGSKIKGSIEWINKNFDFVFFNNQGHAGVDKKCVDKVQGVPWWENLEAHLDHQPWWMEILNGLKIPFSIFIHCLPVTNRKHYPLLSLMTKHPRFCGTLVAKHERIMRAFREDYMFKEAVAGVNWVYFQELPMGIQHLDLMLDVPKRDLVVMTSRITNSKGIMEMLSAMPMINGEVQLHGAIMEAGNKSAVRMYQDNGYQFYHNYEDPQDPNNIFKGEYRPEDLPEIFRHAKVHCDLSSDSSRGPGNSGSLNYVTLEAMAHGVLPIVGKTWNTRGWTSIPTVDPSNAKQVAEVINYYLSHDAERIEMIKENAKILKNYDRRIVTSNILSDLGLVEGLVEKFATA